MVIDIMGCRRSRNPAGTNGWARHAHHLHLSTRYSRSPVYWNDHNDSSSLIFYQKVGLIS